jgi:ABC-type antimicrobial peptide transport system permease subunit
VVKKGKYSVVLPVVILVIAMLAAIASVVWKAAKSNPVEALKHN